LVAVCLGLGCGLALGAPRVDAAAGVLMDAETGSVLWNKEMHERRPVASTTKVMTALLALECSDLDASVRVGKSVLEIHGSNVGLKPGDLVRMDDLLASLLLSSGNDAAVVIAEHVSESVASFADLMNARASQLGGSDTHFVNPHGLYDPDHYSSAYDLALFTREAFRHERFGELVGAKVADVELPSSKDGVVQLINHNKLLWRDGRIDGVKTGYVRQSGHCLIASGEQDGWRLIAVVLDSPDMYAEAQALLDYGFSKFERCVYARPGDAVGQAKVRGGRKGTVPAICEHELAAVIGPGMSESQLEVTLESLKAPVEQGVSVGEARLVLGDSVISRSPLVAGGAVPRSRLIETFLWIMRVVVLLPLLVLVTRTYGKLVKAHRRRRSGIPA